MRVLVIEDNRKLTRTISAALKEHGMTTDEALTGLEGESLALEGRHDVIVLDRMLPDRDGVEICQAVRKAKLDTPIIMLTALSSVDDKVHGLEHGADDYMAKPFKFEELVARIRSLLRRGQAMEGNPLRCEDLELDLNTRVATRGETKHELSGREFGLLEYLMRNQNRVMLRNEIAEHVWHMDMEPTSNVIDVYISGLRKKIDAEGKPPLIHTLKNAGYCLGLRN